MDKDESDIYNALAKKIYYTRKRMRLSQSDLAEAAQLNRAYVSDIENGKRNPSLESLNRIAKALSVPLWILICSIEEHEGDL